MLETLEKDYEVPSAFIYEHVTRNVNSTDLTVNNDCKYMTLVSQYIHMYVSIGCLVLNDMIEYLRSYRFYKEMFHN